MRIVFVNLHSQWMLVKNSAVLIFKNSPALKHKYLLDYLLAQPDIEVASYLNDRAFSIYTHGGPLLQKFLNLFARLESDWIFKKNGINQDKISIIRSKDEIRKDDVVVFYNLFADNFRGFENVDAVKVLSFLHFHGDRHDSARIKKLGIDAVFNEVNLESNCELFRRFYDVPKPWIIIPFIPAARFKKTVPFSQRKNKAFSVGTITYKIHQEFIEVYGDPCDQPIRKAVKIRRDLFRDTADSYSADYNEDDVVKVVKPSDNVLTKYYKKIYNRLHNGRQKQYFSFDMVEKFNEYKMHIVGEEVLGIPGIGFAEGMACGSAYIGMDMPAYRDWGMIPGEHFITYDGTPEGLNATIEYWQRPENQDELERIANNGYEFVRENFTQEKIGEHLLDEFKKLRESKA